MDQHVISHPLLHTGRNMHALSPNDLFLMHKYILQVVTSELCVKKEVPNVIVCQ